jgi:hypothetical protein
MANIQIWDGSTNFIAGESTPFGFYDDDLSFQEDAPKVARYCAEKLGWPVLDIELHERQFYAAFEEAVTAYGKEVIEAITAETLSSQLGGSAGGSAVNQTIFRPSLQNVILTSAQYGTEAGVGGPVTLRTAMIDLVANQQDYNLTSLIGQGAIEIRKVFYEAPPAIMRYFDPYAGTGTGIQSLMDAFDFGSFSPGVNFLLMPASYDILKTQAIEFNDQIRRSGYSFEVVNNHLKLFPVPKNAGKIWFEYYKVKEKQSLDNSANTPGGIGGSVSNISNVPYENPTYGNINSIGKQWIYKYALALAKELLAYVRGKYTTVPIPGSEATLNQQDLLADARTEKAALVENLRAILENTSKLAQLERKAGESNFLQDTLKQVPMVIFVG